MDDERVSREQLDVILRVFDDCRNLIAAGKIQRWEVLKWAVTVNVALAAAAAGFQHNRAAFFLLSFVTAIFGWALIFYYNRRMTRARERLTKIHAFIREQIIDLEKATGNQYGMVKPFSYDKEELYLYSYILAFSAVPTLVIWASS